MPYEDEAPPAAAYANLPRYVEWSTYNTIREAWLFELEQNRLLRAKLKELEGVVTPSSSSSGS